MLRKLPEEFPQKGEYTDNVVTVQHFVTGFPS
jgi:hypothetical protein